MAASNRAFATRSEWLVGPFVEERHRPVGDRELSDDDVVAQLVAEVGLQIGAVIALGFGVELQLDWGVGESDLYAVAVLDDLDGRLVGVGLRGSGELAGAGGGCERGGSRSARV